MRLSESAIALPAQLFNEPWFLVEGLLWAALGVAAIRASTRRVWMISAVATCAILTIVGVLSGIGTIGTFRVGALSVPRHARGAAIAGTVPQNPLLLGGERQ